MASPAARNIEEFAIRRQGDYMETLNRPRLNRPVAFCTFVVLAFVAVAVAVCSLVMRSTPFALQRTSTLLNPTASLTDAASASGTDDAILFIDSLTWESEPTQSRLFLTSSGLDSMERLISVGLTHTTVSAYLDDNHNSIDDETLIYHLYSSGFLWKRQQTETIPTRILPPKTCAIYITVGFGRRG